MAGFATKAPQPKNGLLLDAVGVAELLDCSTRHVENLDSRELMPKPIRLGRLKKWRRSEIESWLAAGAPAREAWESMRGAK